MTPKEILFAWLERVDAKLYWRDTSRPAFELRAYLIGYRIVIVQLFETGQFELYAPISTNNDLGRKLSEAAVQLGVQGPAGIGDLR